MANKLTYNHPDDDLAKIYAPTLVDGALAAGYDLAWLCDDNPARFVRFTTTHLRLVWDLTTSPLAVLLVVLWHTNLNALAGCTAAFETNATNSWPGTPSTGITLTALQGNGYRKNPYLIRTGAAAVRYASLVITGNDLPIILGGTWLGLAARAVTHNPSWGVATPEGQDTTVHRTNLGVKHAFSDSITGGIRGGVISTTVDVGLPALDTWIKACNYRARPCPLIFDPAVNEALLVNWAQDELVPAHQSNNNVTCPVAWDTVSPGAKAL